MGSESKKAVALAAGADEVINYNEADFVQVILGQSKQGVDVILDSIAGKLSEKGMKALAPLGVWSSMDTLRQRVLPLF
ncbi:MAG: zinc-binding dehydrogenase [Deinococcales bacterium]